MFMVVGIDCGWCKLVVFERGWCSTVVVDGLRWWPLVMTYRDGRWWLIVVADGGYIANMLRTGTNIA